MNIHERIARYHLFMMCVINGILKIPYVARLRFMHKWFLVHSNGFNKQISLW